MTKEKIATSSVAPINWRTKLTSNMASRYTVIFLPLFIVGVLSMGYLAYQDRHLQPAPNLTSAQSGVTTHSQPADRLKAQPQPALPKLTAADDTAKTDTGAPAVTNTTDPSPAATSSNGSTGASDTAASLQKTDTSANSDNNSSLQAPKNLKIDLSQLEQLHIQIPLLH
ncbi:MAG: hypothetical protein JWM81_1126 [Candidatus Saccharibacteria bacterium]|nr:hypothetical protein [Candidatus Saccharibacteria bacterium]